MSSGMAQAPPWTTRTGSIAKRSPPPKMTDQSNTALEQRGRTPLPGLAFFFGNVFHIVHVRASLGQDMVQVVADADEGESLLQELAHACGAEQEDSENDFVLARVLDELVGGRAQFWRSVHMGELV